MAGRVETLLETLILVEPRIKSLRLVYRGDPPNIYGDIGLREPIPIALMGEGLGRITSLVLAIGNAQDGVVFIDEVENGLHYSILKDVWKAIGKAAREFNTQIFATTHSLECIRAAHQAFSESEVYDFQYHRLDRNERTEKIEVVTYDQNLIEASIQADFEVR